MALEAVAQMTPMLVLGALSVAWLAETFAEASGYGFMVDMLLGVVGSVLGGLLFWFVIWRDAGMITMLLIGSAGAALVIVAQRIVRPSAHTAA